MKRDIIDIMFYLFFFTRTALFPQPGSHAQDYTLAHQFYDGFASDHKDKNYRPLFTKKIKMLETCCTVLNCLRL